MSTILKFGTLKQIGAVVIAVAIVIVAGTVVGQAPALFGADVAGESEASIEFADQTGDGTSVTIESVSLSDGGFVVVTDTGGDVVGTSEYLEPGDYENVTVEQRNTNDAVMLGQLTATVHHDTDDDETFGAVETDGEEDHPYIVDGYPVTDRATVTLEEGSGSAGDSSTSFLVKSVDAPTTATVDGNFTVTAEIRNPNEFETQQHVEFRLAGNVTERQVLSLEAGDTAETTFEIDTSGIEPGRYTYGIYTTDHGQLGEIRIDSDASPDVSVVDHDGSSVTANATLPSGGFLAVENGDGDVVATSDELEPGTHQNVTIELGGALEEGDAVTVVAYQGVPTDLDNATAYSANGERVAADVVLGDANSSATAT